MDTIAVHNFHMTILSIAIRHLTTTTNTTMSVVSF